MPGSTLEYDSRTTVAGVQTPSRFQVAMEDERGRWLRRRFIGYCILAVVLNGFSLLFAGFNDPSTRLWLIGSVSMSMVVITAALIYAWRSPPKAKTMIRVAVWLCILTSVMGLATNRLAFELEMTSDEATAEFRQDVQVGSNMAARREAEMAESLRAETAFLALSSQLEDAERALANAQTTIEKTDEHPALEAWQAQVDQLRASAGVLREQVEASEEFLAPMQFPRSTPVPGVITPDGGPSRALRAGLAGVWALCTIVFLGHMVSCLIIPWTFRESLFPGLVVFNAFVLILIIDIQFSDLPWWAALALMAGAIVVLVPGSLWCFWRYTRFPKVFRTRYEADRYKQLSKDLSGARQIHEAVLPPQKNYGAVRLNYVYEPMSQIGGDLLYVRETDGADGSVSAVLLDVTGHGVAAALTVNRLLGELDRIYGENPNVSPGKVLSGLNHYVHLTLVRHGVFVTGLALRLEPGDANGNLRYANAGHPPAFACCNGDCQRLEPTTFMLGVMDDAGFDSNEQSYHLDPGDAVLFYTDGAAEARDDRGRQIGTKGLEKLFHAMSGDRQPGDWPKVILGHVAQHRNRPPDDDTIVASMYRAAERHAGT